MKKKITVLVLSSCMLLSTLVPSSVACAEEFVDDSTVVETVHTPEMPPGVYAEVHEDGSISVVKTDPMLKANVSRWGSSIYTNVAVSTGVATNAINTAFYSGLGSILGIFGVVPPWALQGLLNAVGWTQMGSKPGASVANLWDKNKNGWIGFYFQRGYDAAGKEVATRYSTL